MRINWVFASGYQLDPTIDIDRVKSVGATWGSWTTWRSCSTDNVICYDFDKCRDLLNRAFQTVCNFYVPKKLYQDLNRPVGVKLFEGDFLQDLDHREDIIALHMTATISDIVLLLGFDLSTPISLSDPMANHRIKNYHGLLNHVIRTSDCQYVVIDHHNDLDKAYKNLPNLTTDSLSGALELLG